MNWFKGLFSGETERDREIDAHIEMVNIRISIQKEAEKKFNKAYSKLNSFAILKVNLAVFSVAPGKLTIKLPLIIMSNSLHILIAFSWFSIVFALFDFLNTSLSQCSNPKEILLNPAFFINFNNS